MRDDGARFALVAFTSKPGRKTTIITISEDAIPSAQERNWIVLGRDSQIVAEPSLPPAQSNPRRTVTDD